MTRILALLVSVCLAPLVLADAKPTLLIFPKKIDLNGKNDRQSFVIQEVDADGMSKDVTASAKVTLADPNIATLNKNQVVSATDGSTKIVVQSGKFIAEAIVDVKNAEKARAMSFRLDVMPVFMKHGCNNGSCHGAARGKDGFMLSLFGYDPAGDYHRLTRQVIGRRLDLAVPEKSLLLEKSVGAAPHTGGKLFDTNQEDYRTLLEWIKAGAVDDGSNTPEPVGIELLPAKVVFLGSKQTQKTVVLAKYSDGTVRDVTRLSLYMTSNEAIASIDKEGVVTGGGRGAAFVFARFNKFTVGSEVIVLPTNDLFTWTNPPESNYIDTLVFDKLKKLRMAPSELCSDEVFLRRVYFDLIGLPPTRSEYESFLADKNPQKRAKLIDALIERPDFVDMWTMKWGELLRIRAANNVPQYGRDAKAMYSYASWVKEQMTQNRPLNEFVAELLVGNGSNFKQPTANLYTSSDRLTPEKTAEDIAQVFLGTRIQCAQCHNHPFDRWTMDDYYGFTAFFAGVNLKRGVEGREVIVTNNNNSNTVAHPVDGRRMKPKFLGGEVPAVDGQDPRQSLAKWLTSADNVAFSQTMANMIWSHFFGRGIVDPVDDVRISNPPSNKELLEALGQKLSSYNFDLKRYVRDLCNSRTYQLAVSTNLTNELDETNFSHSYVRRLRAEVLLDAITRITGTEDRFPLSPPGTRAVQIHTGEVTNYFLTTFGRAPRETPCSCEVNKEANLSQALHLVNGDTLSNKIAQSKLISTMITQKKKPAEIIEELYLRALTRKPNDGELSRLQDLVKKELGDPARVQEIVKLQAGNDPTYARSVERIAKAKEDFKKLSKESKEAIAAERQIKVMEQTVQSIQQRYEASAAISVYGDILWSLFNSTEFTFNH
jgi:hypothetical protein